MLRKVVILCGPRPGYGYCPVPPLTNSAPEKNIFRLVENEYGEGIEINVISACSNTQVMQLKNHQLHGNYTNIPFPEYAFEISQSRVLNNRLINGFCKFVFGTSDLFTWVYLERAVKVVRSIDPDIIFINSLPQYIRFLRKRFPEKKLGLFQRGEMGESRKYLHLLDCIVTNSKGITGYIRQLLNDVDVVVKEIPNTLEDAYCVASKIYSPPPLKKVIYTGRVISDKGVFELLSAFQIVQKEIADVHLKIVGGNFDGKKISDYESKLVQYSTEKRLNVEFVGQVPNAELSHQYLNSDVAIFPSICLESFGMVALEAMRCGLPVIASRRPGFEELIVHGETGLIVDDPQDVRSLAEAMLKVLKDPQLARSMGEKGYQRSLNYTPMAAAKCFSEIVLKLV